jgi:GAF domain-containing protein
VQPTAGCHAAVERLLLATDADSVVAACTQALAEFDIKGEWQWRSAQDSAALLTTEPGQAEDPATGRSLVLAGTDDALAAADAANVAWVGRLAATRLRQLAESARLYEAISRLALAERLQRALFAIAEQSGADHAMPDMMRALHAIVASLMYAENFYIVLYDATAQVVRFPYYVDIVDTDPPSPDSPVPLDDLRHSLTWNLLQEGRPMMGSEAELKQAFGDGLVPMGPHCEHWLGVPLLRDGAVVGGIVMQSYRADTHYSQQDQDLLIYVAQHVQIALERREAHLELGRRVAERTVALREANRVLRQQVLQRQRGERLQAALFRIAELANTSDSLDTFYAAVHQVISGLLYARNFYIAVTDEETGLLTFPYSVDEIDQKREPRAPISTGCANKAKSTALARVRCAGWGCRSRSATSRWACWRCKAIRRDTCTTSATRNCSPLSATTLPTRCSASMRPRHSSRPMRGSNGASPSVPVRWRWPIATCANRLPSASASSAGSSTKPCTTR